jgi:hypothetical protein
MFVANQVRLWLSILDYNLGNFIRRLVLPHVSNIYDKIGVSNRTEAARFLLAQGLVALEESGSSNT